MSSINQVASDLYKAISESDERKVQPYDVKATVLREEGNIVWVKIPGGVDETPVQKTNNANVGDDVMVRISGGKAWLLGNETSPATDNAVANAATQLAEGAGNLAKTAADSATEAQQNAQIAYIYADQASDNAATAQTAANNASIYANTALDQLGIVQDVVGVLDLLSTNATYTLTQDTEIVPGKWYFTRSGTSPAYVYSVVTNPVSADIATYYELTDIDAAVQSYVTSRLSVTADGLWIQDPNMATKILLSSTDGVVLYGPSGTVIGRYGSTAQIGDAASFHIEMDGTELGFYQADRKVAYVSNQQLYITQSVVLQQMDLGTKVSDGGLGQWSWKVHANGATPRRNNLNLKWIG